MHTFRLAFVCAFAGAVMACNVASLHAAPLPTNVATMKSTVADSSIQVRWGGWRGAGWGYRGFGGWGAGALAGAIIGGAIASSLMAIMEARTTAATTPAPITAATTPPIATIRHMSTMVGKQSKNPGPLASTDLTAGGLGGIGKSGGFNRETTPGVSAQLIDALRSEARQRRMHALWCVDSCLRSGL